MSKIKVQKQKVPNYQTSKEMLPLKEYALLLIIFLVSLFFITTFSNPALFLNDEWITSNQLYQLNNGHQIVVNEGTYGTYDTGEVSEYFIAHGNILQYTLLLPLFSLPVLRLFGNFGDNFRFLIVLIWSFIPMAIALLIATYYPQYAKIHGVRWVWPAIILSFFLFLMNMLLYYPFPFTDTHAPREVAAIVFTNHILFALTAVIIFQIAMTIFSAHRWKSLFAMILVIVNSSFLFWAGNAKDHLLVAFLFSLTILFFIRYLRTRTYYNAGIGFILIGLLAWARPEIGFTVFIFTLVFFIINAYLNFQKEKREYFLFLKDLSAVLFIIPGIIPLLVNNYLVTGKPFSPTFFVSTTLPELNTTGTVTTGSASPPILTDVTQGISSTSGFLESAFSFLSFSPINVLTSLPKVIFWPESGNMSFAVVCPLTIFALLTLLFLIRKKTNLQDNQTIIFLAFMVVAVFFAYLNRIQILNSDGGIIPDMRYLSPAYIPLGLMGTISLFMVLKKQPAVELIKKYIIIAVILVFVFLISLMVFQPFGGFYKGYSLFYQVLTYCVIGVLIVLFILYRNGTIQFRYLAAGILILLAIPLSWQMMMVFLYSVAKFNGYPFWIPIVEQFFNTFIKVTDIR
jgi:hypothetical protein